jgi:hypothetical protein
VGVGRRLSAAAAAAGVLALAACGGSNAPSTQAKSAPCLRKLGYEVRSATDLIAGTAANGGLVATLRDETLTVGFGEDDADGTRLARAYERVAPRRLRDLIYPLRNAVLVWTIAPTLEQKLAAEKCIR